MRQDVKDFADAMEAGWQKVPNMCWCFFKRDDNKIIAACAMGHALLGKGEITAARVSQLFPIIQKQMVKNIFQGSEADTKVNLEIALNELVKEGWTTPQVIEWLRSHQED